MTNGEFETINRFFNKEKILKKNILVGIGDDCAILSIPKDKYVAVSTDTMVEGTHFLPDINPGNLAYKSISMSLSDLAAVGADPVWSSLSITLPKIDQDWLNSFSTSFLKQIRRYRMQLIGGDTSKGPMSLTITTHGLIPKKDPLLTRSGASIGDQIFVTGTLGDSAAGLAILKNQVTIRDDNDRLYLINRHLRPTPRISFGKILRKVASSAIDISDGIISDLKHILDSSHCGAYINLNQIPLSSALLRNFDRKTSMRFALSGGEDYELCFTISRKLSYILKKNIKKDFHISKIGHTIPKNEGIQIVYHKKKIQNEWKGYDHFL